jgi:hypothetical protein
VQQAKELRVQALQPQSRGLQYEVLLQPYREQSEVEAV